MYEKSRLKFQERATTATPLDLKNLGGVFFVLVAGTTIGFFGSFLEKAVRIYKRAKRAKATFKEELCKEFKIFIQFKMMERSTSITNNNIK